MRGGTLARPSRLGGFVAGRLAAWPAMPACLLLLVAAFAPQLADAASYGWDSTVGTGWSTAASWASDAVPTWANTTDVAFYQNVTSVFNTNLGTSDVTMRQLFLYQTDIGSAYTGNTPSTLNNITINTSNSNTAGAGTARVLNFARSVSTQNSNIFFSNVSKNVTIGTGTGSINILAGAGLEVFNYGSGTLTFGSPITESAAGKAFIVSGSGNGTTVFTAANTYTGTTTINSGTLRIGTGGNLSGASVIAAGAVLEFNSSDATAGGAISGAGSIVKNGSGTTSFSAQTYTGGLTLNAGAVDLASSGALGVGGTFTVNGGAFGAVGGSNRTLSNPIVFNANATLSGSNVRTATYTGAVDLGGATRTLTVSQTTTINGTISNGGLTKAGTFPLTLGGSNSFTGPTTVTSGTLVLNNANALAGSTFGGGAGSLSFGTLTSATFGGMSGSTNLALQNASAAAVALSVGANGGSTTYSAALSGAGSLVKVGSGTFTFAGTTANGVPTSVSAGKFVANGILGTGSLSVAAAAWLAGTGTVSGAVMVDGILSPGASPGMLTLGSLDLGSTSTTIMELAGTTRGSLYDSIDITAGGIGYGGTLQLDFQQTFADNTSFVLFGISTGTGSRTGSFASVTAVGSYGTLTFTNDGSGVWSSGATGVSNQEIRFTQSTGEVIVVPEPSTTAVIAAGISIAWLCRRRRPRGRPLAGLDGPCC